MQHDYWQIQESNHPLYPDIIWSRPENAQTAGKLLIVGGNAHGFAQVALSYESAKQAGAGSIRILMPDVLQKTVSMLQTGCYFAPSNPSGGFSKLALADLIEHAQWADAVLFAGEFGRNSETAILLESFIQKYEGLLIIAKDSIDYFINSPANLLLDRPKTCFVGSSAQIQKIASHNGAIKPITLAQDLNNFVEALHEFTIKHKAHFITQHQNMVVVSAGEKVSTTKSKFPIDNENSVWRTPVAASAAVFWLQNTNKPYQALTSSVL